MHNKIDKYLSEIEYVGSYEDHEYGSEQLTDRMIDFFMILDPDNLYDEQLDQYMNIMGDFDSYADDDSEWDDEWVEGDDEDDIGEGSVNEAPPLLRQKRDRIARRERKIEYRKKKSQLKTKAKSWRRTAAYKKYTRKKKKMAKRGKTSTGSRIRKFY